MKHITQTINQYIPQIFITFTLMLMALSCVMPLSASAQNQQDINARAKGQACKAIGNCAGGENTISKTIKTVINILSAVGGIIAVILVVIGGVKYMTSGGDSNSAANARNTIIYAIVGLIIVAFAQIIVKFVLQQV